MSIREKKLEEWAGRELILPTGYENNNPMKIKRIQQDFKRGKGFHYLFTGCTGCGKTYLAKLILEQVKQIGKTSFIDSRKIYREYLRLLSSTAVDKAESLRKLFSRFSADFAVLDDLGSERPFTETSTSFMGELILERYDLINEQKVLGTIITTNLRAQDIERNYGDRILDRISQHYVIMPFKEVSFRNRKLQVVEG